MKGRDDYLAEMDRWSIVANRLGLRLSGWTYGRSATMVDDADGHFVLEGRSSSSMPLLERLEDAMGIHRQNTPDAASRAGRRPRRPHKPKDPGSIPGRGTNTRRKEYD